MKRSDALSASPRRAFDRLWRGLGLGVAALTTTASAALPAPYVEATANRVYNQLFCDDPDLYREQDAASADWQRVLFASFPDARSVRFLAETEAEESRVRLLAYRWLQGQGHAVPQGVLLGVVVEVPIDGGLDVLAAYRDGRVRYINHAGRLVFMDALPSGVTEKHQLLMAASQMAIRRPSAASARPFAPVTGSGVRLSFLAADGIHVAEGRFDVLQRDPLHGPVLLGAAELLRSVTMAVAQRGAASGRRE